MCHKVFVVFLISLVSIQLSAAASIVTKCKSTDSKCLVSSATALIPAFAAGIPELNVERMDPLYLKHIEGSSSNLKLLIDNVTVTGLGTCDIQKVERNIAKAKIYVTIFCNKVDVKGLYEMDGRILVLPIQGKGDAQVILNKLLLSAEVNMGDKTDKQGVKHWDIKSYEHKWELKDNAKIRLDNLFNGNQELAKAVNDLFDSSANDVVYEVGVPIVKAIVEKVVRNIDHFFHKLPADDLSID